MQGFREVWNSGPVPKILVGLFVGSGCLLCCASIVALGATMPADQAPTLTVFSSVQPILGATQPAILTPTLAQPTVPASVTPLPAMATSAPTLTYTAAPTNTPWPTNTLMPTHTPIPTQTAIPSKTPTPLPPAGVPAACTCYGPDLDCKHFGTHAEAQACFDYCKSLGYGDVYSLDRNNDQVACEDLP